MARKRELLGKAVEDIYTGFKGIVIGVTDHLYGCRTCVVEPTVLKGDGTMSERQGLDEQRLKVSRDKQPEAKITTTDCLISLGDHVRDTYTGFEGIAAAITTWTSGRVTIGIEPTSLKDDGSMKDAAYVDFQRVEVVAPDKPEVAEGSTAPTGGPQRVGPNLERPTR